MTTVHSSARAADSPRFGGLAVAASALLIAAALSGCSAMRSGSDDDGAGPTADAATTPAAPAVTPTAAAAPPGPPPPAPFPEAVEAAADGLLGSASNSLADSSRSPRYPVLIDPLVDGVTGAESYASRSMGTLLAEEIQANWPNFELIDFTSENVAKSPLVLVGTFTGVNAEKKAIGPRDSYRICLSLADLSTGKVVAKGLAFAETEGVDARPTMFFEDSPAWLNDPRSQAYIKTCQGPKAGDPIPPGYLEGILAATFISDAIEAYEAGRYQDALNLYDSALQTTAGDQLRVYNGVYLANWKLGQQPQAAEAFGDIVDYGLRNGQLGVKVLFKPGSTAYWPDPRVTEPYPMWLDQIADKAATSDSCLEIGGHTSPTGTPALNDRLSLLRAESIRSQVVADQPALEQKSIAAGFGSSENIIGTGTDDLSDALDRRVEFTPIAC